MKTRMIKTDNSPSKLISGLVFLLSVTLSLAAVWLMRHVQYLLNADSKINLEEIVTQNKNAITSRLMMRMNELDFTAAKVADLLKNVPEADASNVLGLLKQYALENNDPSLFIADKSGNIPFKGRESSNISGRNYFRLAVNGISNISDKLISRFDGNDVFVISAPLYFQGEIIGTVQQVLKEKEMMELCSLSLFSSQGYMHIINSDGYVILHSPHSQCQQKSDNYLRDLFAHGNTASSTQLQKDIQNKVSGFMNTEIDGLRMFSAYTPIDKIHDWFLITSAPVDVISANANTVITMFYVILFVLILVFICIISYFAWYKNKQRAHLERIAFVDPVTGGSTYSKFQVAAVDILRANMNKNYVIIQFDIDNFKYINNFYGFAFGDEVLKYIDNSIQSQINNNELVARVSSDHFVLLMLDFTEARIQSMLHSINNKEISLYFSVGVYAVTDLKESINLMVDKATVAAQSVKGRLHKKVALYSKDFDQRIQHNELLKRAVQQALDSHEFEPFYQPKVDIRTGQLVGAEALVRWRKADGTFIYPNDFIPLCEETGLIMDVDMQVYEKVLAFQRTLLDEGAHCVPISSNFSRLHLQEDDFLPNIVKKQKEYAIPAYLLELELTESTIFDNLELILSFTQKLHFHQLAIAMDDFGSGYSSLHMLKDIPIDVLKIDKGFLSESNDNTRRNIIFSSIVSMVRKLGIQVVVEGVEYLENVQLMQECGCFVAQGYFFAKPMPEHDFMELVRSGRSLLPPDMKSLLAQKSISEISQG